MQQKSPATRRSREYGRLARQCAQENRGYAAFLQNLLELEVQSRQAKAIIGRIKEAGFPAEKEVSGFDFTALPKLNKKRILDLSGCEFIRKRECAVFIGSPEVGKTHLAIALGREACRRGLRVKFHTATWLATVRAARAFYASVFMRTKLRALFVRGRRPRDCQILIADACE